MPLRVIPERGKVSENGEESSPSKSPDVLHEHEAGSKLANETAKLSPESGALTVQAGTLAGEADVLAGESPADGVDPGDPESSKSGSVEGSHVVMDGHLGPMLRQHAPAPGVDLAEGDGLEPRALESEREAAYAAEQVQQRGPRRGAHDQLTELAMTRRRGRRSGWLGRSSGGTWSAGISTISGSLAPS